MKRQKAPIVEVTLMQHVSKGSIVRYSKADGLTVTTPEGCVVVQAKDGVVLIGAAPGKAKA